MADNQGQSSPKLKNQRQFKRLTFDCQGQLFSGKEFWLCQVINLSLKGIKISRPPEWAGTIKDSYRFLLSLNNSPSISMNVKVMHISSDALGLKWHKIDIDSFNRLKRIIELNTLNKNQLSEEIPLLNK